MVTVFTRPRSPYFWLRYRAAPGQPQKRESTGIAHNGRKQPAKDSPVIEVVSKLEERLLRSKYGLSPSVQPRKIKDFATEYVNSLTDYEQSTRESRENYLSTWADWCAGQGLTLLSEINSQNMTDWVDDLKTRNASLTVRNKICCLRLALDEARRRHYIQFEENPLAGVKIRRPKGKPRDGYTDDELRALRSIEEPEYLRIAVETSLWTGCRSNSLFYLQWGHVDFEAHVIFINRSKTGEYFVPMSDELEKCLTAWRAAEWKEERGKAGDLVLVRLEGKRRNYLSAQFGYHRRRLGLTRGSFHWLRHTLPGRLHLAGVPLDVRQRILNHKSADVHRDYLHLEASKLREYVNQVRFG